MNIKTSVLHLKGAKGAKVRKEKQFVAPDALLSPLRSLRLRAFAVRYLG